jgi:hypothetical protein
VSDDPLLRQEALRFIAQVVRHYRDESKIAYWQVENEPLDPSGPARWRIGADFLTEEVALVRTLDTRQRPIVVNLFLDGDPLSLLPSRRGELRERAQTLLKVADILGLDVYPNRSQRLVGLNLYFSWPRPFWEPHVLDLQQLAQAAGKPSWIIEAQAEPWEPGAVVHTAATPSRSLHPGTAAATFQRLHSAGFPIILFWGPEYWYLRQQHHQDDGWWTTLAPYFNASAAADPR